MEISGEVQQDIPQELNNLNQVEEVKHQQEDQ